jgi:hypothetical protein
MLAVLLDFSIVANFKRKVATSVVEIATAKEYSKQGCKG